MEFQKNIERILGSAFNLSNSKPILAIFILWFFVHLIILVSSWSYHDSGFWPFSDEDIEAYSIEEFLVYTLGPIVLLLFKVLVKSENSIKSNQKPEVIQNTERQIDAEYLGNSKAMNIGILLLFVGFIQALAEVDPEYMGLVSLYLLTVRVGVAFWVKKIATFLNRKPTWWVVFAVLSPGITLIVVSRQKKYLQLPID